MVLKKTISSKAERLLISRKFTKTGSLNQLK